jgi:uncharacterized protein YjeT (DUF2065 family)
MNKKQMTQAVSIFVIFTIVGLLMILVPYRIDLAQTATEAALQNSLPLIGSALVGAGMVFFLLEMTRMERERGIDGTKLGE